MKALADLISALEDLNAHMPNGISAKSMDNTNGFDGLSIAKQLRDSQELWESIASGESVEAHEARIAKALKRLDKSQGDLSETNKILPDEMEWLSQGIMEIPPYTKESLQEDVKGIIQNLEYWIAEES